MTEFRDRIDDFHQLQAEVLGISVDSPHSHKAFADQLKVSFPLLSDFNREVIPLYGVEIPDQRGFKRVAQRSVFVVDRSGTVRYRWLAENPGKLPDIDAVLAATREAAK